MKTTAWYSGDQKPVRVGVYERKYSFGIYCCWWNGEAFQAWDSTPALCAKRAQRSRLVSGLQSLPWRGVKGPAK